MSMISALIESLKEDSNLLKDSNSRITKDIQEAIVTIEELGEKVYKSNMERSERYYAEIGLTVPENPTNGDMIRAMFPNTHIEEGSKYVLLKSEYDNVAIWNSWWYAPYKKGGKDI